MSGVFFETFVISEILKSYSNRGLDYRYFVSYCRGKDRIRKKNGAAVQEEAEIDFIIEQDGVLYPICMCPMPGALRENVLQIPYWYI